LTVCEATGASRTPVREAFLRLQADGLLQFLPKKGAFVFLISDSEIRDVMQVRMMVENWCIRRSAISAAFNLAEFDRLLRVQGAMFEDREAFIDSARMFHRHIVQAADNAVLSELYERLRERQLGMGLAAITAGHERSRQVLEEHGAIVDALRANDPAGAAHAMRHHLSSTLVTLQHLSQGPLWSFVDKDLEFSHGGSRG